jgi:hypothetical protein
MPVTRYRDVAEMPPPPLATGEELARRIRQVWARAAKLGRLRPPRGVQRFASIEEAQEARDAATRLRIERLAEQR